MSLTIHTGRPVESTGRHRAVPHKCRALPAVLLARMLHGRAWFTALTAVCALALLLAMLEEAAEFAFGGEVPHLLIAAAILLALVLYGARTGTGENPPGVGVWDVVYFASIGAAVIAESADFWLGQEWEHLAIIAAIAVATCIYAIRCWTQD